MIQRSSIFSFHESSAKTLRLPYEYTCKRTPRYKSGFAILEYGSGPTPVPIRSGIPWEELERDKTLSRSTDSLQGREIVVVGGSGGIGVAISEMLIRERVRLIITYRVNQERALRWKDSAMILQADLTSSADRARILHLTPMLYGIVVLSGDPARSTSAMDLAGTMSRSHDTNYLGPILFAREAADHMKAIRSPGSIVLVSTMQANALFPGSTAYAAQKAALQHAAKILAKECRGSSGIRVNVVSPGITAAGMAEASIAAGKYNHFIEQGILARFGRPQDVAGAIRFFLEPDNYITGQILCVDGGITL
jgi:3-oxoacyl-[acyl-carrier protein] reductase